MYPTEDLKLLELRKLRARLSILARRQQCITAGREINQTVETLEAWRQRIVQWSGVLKFAPGVFGIFRGLRGLARSHASTPEEPRPSKTGKVATALRWITTGLKAYNTFRR